MMGRGSGRSCSKAQKEKVEEAKVDDEKIEGRKGTRLMKRQETDGATNGRTDGPTY